MRHAVIVVAALLILPLCVPVAHAGERVATVRAVEVTDWFEAVGTVRPFVEVSVEAQVTGRVLEVLVRPGQRVEQGQLLLRLEPGQSEARRQQAMQAVNSARAEFERAQSAHERMQELFSKNVISKEEMESAQAAFLSARANLAAAQDGLREAGIGVGFTEIMAQEGGEVARRHVDPGDLAFPGKRLLTLQTGGSLRLEALVREGLISKVGIGDNLPVVIDSLDVRVECRVNEIEPLADPTTRSFLVKASLPELSGLYPGMYAKLLVPMARRTAMVVPAGAVTRVGQLETVKVRHGDGWSVVFVRTGRELDAGLEILSGLSSGEEVLLGEDL